MKVESTRKNDQIKDTMRSNHTKKSDGGFKQKMDQKIKDLHEQDKSIMLSGPWGGNGGNQWDDGIHSGIREITLVYSSCIDSIRVTYDYNVKPLLAEKHGGMGGTQSAQINLQFPEEVLISVSGHYCPVVYGGGPVIRSLTFKSNQRTYGPFGVEEGTPFNFLTNGDYIVGNQWDDGIHSGIRDITLVYSTCIDSIHVTYDNNVKPLLDEKHGGMGGTQSAQIKLQFPEEVLISVGGHYCPVVYGGGPVILYHSLSRATKGHMRHLGLKKEHPSIS
ncbi:jacalin-related lectin 19-like protein [Tanacetum coccineum]